MTYKAGFAATILLGGFAILASPLAAQEKKATPAEQRGPTKKSTSEVPLKEERVASKPEDKSKLRERKNAEGPRALGQPNAFWYPSSSLGGFHMAGPRGRGIYRWVTSVQVDWDTAWTFVDNLSVGDRQGWTYREDGYEFYLFFSANYTADCGWAKYQIMWSYDNVDFNHFDCAY